jgi:peptidoglycan/xylan/chitin deacetylase (PgdA/CDA1 family)
MMGPFSRCLSILIYHRVVPESDPLLPSLVSAEEFDRQLALLGRWFTLLPLREAVARLRDEALPMRAACITFDDGYADNFTVALPILVRRKVRATFFLAAGFLDGGRMWNDTVIETVRRANGASLDARRFGFDVLPLTGIEERRRAIDVLLASLKYLPMQERQRRVDELSAAATIALPSDLMMTSDQVRRLHASGMEVGGHTVSHPILARLDPEGAQKEILEGKRRLEGITGAPVRLFAYPNGKPGHDYGREHVAMVKELGFDAAVSTAWGVAHAASDLFQLPRFTPWDRTNAKFLMRLLHNTFRTSPECV